MTGLVPSEDAVNHLVNHIVDSLRGSMLNIQLQKAAQVEAQKSNLKVADLKRGIIAGLSKAGYEKKLQNAVYQLMQNQTKATSPHQPPDHVKEPISYIRKAQVNWEKRILKSLNSMCTELSVPLARRRPDKEQKEMSTKWTELGTDEPALNYVLTRLALLTTNYVHRLCRAQWMGMVDVLHSTIAYPTDLYTVYAHSWQQEDLSQFRPVYAPKDFLEVIACLKNPNLVDNGENLVFSNMWGIIQVPLRVKDIHELRLQFSEMSINQCQTGVDDTPDIPHELFELDRNRLAKKVLSSNHSPIAQEFSKKGCPLSYRANVWCQILGIQVDDVDALYYEQLKACVLQHDLLVDSLIYKDVKLTSVNDDQYFVFEDYLYQVLLPFSRDTVVLQHFAQSSASPAKSYIRGRLGVDDFMVTYPPNGVIPFHGFSMYVAPLCYIFNDPIVLYFVFRELYMRYFFRLHTLSSHNQGIVSLCLLFEMLLQTNEPALFFHLKGIGIQPLRIAFKWLIRAFSGYLASEQVLLLWDRILAYNSLEILPVLAMAIFSFRKTNLLQVQTFNAAEAVLADLTTLKVIPLIQLTLFSQ